VIRLEGVASDKELSEHCRSFLAAYKSPKKWLYVDVLPLNAAGKIDKPALRQNSGAA
jgi:acyl-CoA synthetase (AMP-forming)/AMP-acid ligase II